MGGGADELHGLDSDPLAVVVDEGKLDQAGGGVEHADVDIGFMEHLANLVADRVVDALHIQLGRQRLLHAVDDGQLGGPLLGLVQQPLRLGELPRVLQRRAHRPRQGL